MTLNRSVEPSSDAVVVSDVPVAPGIGPQFAPAPSQRSHWYENRSPVGAHAPTLPVSVAPTTGVPLTVGTAVFVGVLKFLPAELPLANRPRHTASTPAVASQGFRFPTAHVSARRGAGCFPQMRG
jgi:hypothetical protein